MKKFFLPILFLISVLGLGLVVSCEIGMGEALDLEAPEITVTSPTPLSYTHKDITASGTCKDNVRVTEVEARNRETGALYGRGAISGDDWVMNLRIDEEGPIDVVFTAKDAVGNASVKSSKTIILMVDETAPESLSWYVDRGDGVQVPFYERSQLENLNTNLEKNKHIPQNEAFTIYGRFNDAISIKYITLTLKENGNLVLSKTLSARNVQQGDDGYNSYPSGFRYIGDGESVYAPFWNFTHNELKTAMSSLDTGKHYLEVSYYSIDDHGNNDEQSVGYILWYPESDKPGINNASASEENGMDTISVGIGSSLSVDVFDDDELSELKYDFISKNDYNTGGFTETNLASKKNQLTKSVALGSGVKSYPLSVKAAESSGEYYLLIYAEDRNDNISGHVKKTAAKIYKVIVSDASLPVIIITSPSENAIPPIVEFAMDGSHEKPLDPVNPGTSGNYNFIDTVPSSIDSNHNNFVFSGYAYDTSGSKQISIIYVPSVGTSYTTDALLEARAEEVYNQYKNETEKKLTTGEIIRTYKFPTQKTKAPTDKGYKEKFNIAFDVENDFPAEKNAKKFFRIILTDTDHTEQNPHFDKKTFYLGQDDVKPTVNIATPADNMIVTDYLHDDLVLRFNATKENGLAIDKTTYKIVRKDFEEGTSHPLVWTLANGGLTEVGDYVEATIPKETLKIWAEGLTQSGYTYKSDVQPVFKFFAKDVLGNEGTDQRAVVLSPLPALESISIDKVSGTYPAGNTPFKFQAKFSDTVKVTGAPRLKLKGLKLMKDYNLNPENDYDASKDEDKVYYANYTTGSGTDTLTFTLSNIEPNVYTPDGTTLSCDLGKIDLNGGTIVTGTKGTGSATIDFVSQSNFWDSTDTSQTTIRRDIKIDAIAPRIKNITATVADISKTNNIFYTNENREIVLSVEFTERFTNKVLVSGNPVFNANGLTFKFQSVDGAIVKFSHKVAAGEDRTVTCNLANCIDAASMLQIKDEAGNQMVSGTGTKSPGVVIDTTAPRVPTFTGIPKDANGNYEKIYNTSPVIEIAADTRDTDVNQLEYSLNGGLTWAVYNSSTKARLPGSGSYIFMARATDYAGNYSANTEGVDMTLNDTFPTVEEISIGIVDGKYKAGTNVEFKVFLSDVIEPFKQKTTVNGAEEYTAYLKFTDKNGNNVRTIPVTASSIRTNKISFKYKVTAEDEIKGVKISEVNLAHIQDKYSNQASAATMARINTLIADPDGTCQRPNLVLDGMKPYIKSYWFVSNPTSGQKHTYPSAAFTSSDEVAAECANDSFKIYLQFNENLIKESGKIILKRKGVWAIPPVIPAAEFVDIYNKISSNADREKLVKTKGDTPSGKLVDEKLDDKFGLPVGPYRKITHGLKQSGSYAVPDTDTKYVLAFDYGLYDTTGTVKDIRDVLSSIDYDKHSLEVNSSLVSFIGSNVSQGLTSDILVISFADKIEDGREWELKIPASAFHDETGNIFDGLKYDGESGSANTFALWSNKVAAPVVRVNRYSHGYGAYGADANGNKKEITGFVTIKEVDQGSFDTNNSGTKIKPLGYAEARIDCETPNVTIKYQVMNSGTKAKSSSFTWKTQDGRNDDYSQHSDIPDISLSSLKTTTGGTAYSEIIKVGDVSNDTARFRTARKDYVTAYATKSNVSNFTTSDAGYEGVFKTVILTRKGNTYTSQINIEGGTTSGGEPKVSGFPLRDATRDYRYSKNAYCVTNDETNAYWAWVSYEIVSTNWAYLQVRTNFSSKYAEHSYGQILLLNNFSTWE